METAVDDLMVNGLVAVPEQKYFDPIFVFQTNSKFLKIYFVSKSSIESIFKKPDRCFSLKFCTHLIN